MDRRRCSFFSDVGCIITKEANNDDNRLRGGVEYYKVERKEQREIVGPRMQFFLTRCIFRCVFLFCANEDGQVTSAENFKLL